MAAEYSVNTYTVLLKLQLIFSVTVIMDGNMSLLTLAVFWDAILCISFCCLYLHPNMHFEAEFTSETLITFPPTTRRHTPQNNRSRNLSPENLNSRLDCFQKAM
jgi:hypothetical protein